MVKAGCYVSLQRPGTLGACWLIAPYLLFIVLRLDQAQKRHVAPGKNVRLPQLAVLHTLSHV